MEHSGCVPGGGVERALVGPSSIRSDRRPGHLLYMVKKVEALGFGLSWF